MRCEWDTYLNLLPQWMRQDVDRLGKQSLQELRIRIGILPELIMQDSSVCLRQAATKNDIDYIINAASEYSPWSAATTAQGYITAKGGHRIGICGTAVVKGGKMTGFSQTSSVCIRVARDFGGIAKNLLNINESILIIGPPGSGKTTLLRDLIREKADNGQGSVAVVDEREELFPTNRGQVCFDTGKQTDIIRGCTKSEGIMIVLRSMNPHWIAVDEITAKEDCDALLHAGWCGVRLLATAHAASVSDLMSRPVYQSIVKYGLFNAVVALNRDKSWRIERIPLCL